MQELKVFPSKDLRHTLDAADAALAEKTSAAMYAYFEHHRPHSNGFYAFDFGSSEQVYSMPVINAIRRAWGKEYNTLQPYPTLLVLFPDDFLDYARSWPLAAYTKAAIQIDTLLAWNVNTTGKAA